MISARRTIYAGCLCHLGTVCSRQSRRPVRNNEEQNSYLCAFMYPRGTMDSHSSTIHPGPTPLSQRFPVLQSDIERSLAQQLTRTICYDLPFVYDLTMPPAIQSSIFLVIIKGGPKLEQSPSRNLPECRDRRRRGPPRPCLSEPASDFAADCPVNIRRWRCLGLTPTHPRDTPS